jgi:hypothetical protein
MEDRDPAFEQRSAVNRRFSTVTIALKQAYAKYMLQVSN